ncbi:MAG: YaeQ family protein [Thiotrichales bacterium]
MALKSTLFKAELQIADLDRNYYADHALTLARHPSETDERMMVRLLAFALYADEHLTFGKGLCVDDEPDLWQKDLTGVIERWIDVGEPQEKWIRRACGRADQVVILSYGGRGADLWWTQNATRLARFENLTVVSLPGTTVQALAALAQRSMRLQVTLQEGAVWLTDDATTVQFEPIVLSQAARSTRR